MFQPALSSRSKSSSKIVTPANQEKSNNYNTFGSNANSLTTFKATEHQTIQVDDDNAADELYEPCVLETQFKEDTKQHLLKCLNEDISLSKIQRSFRHMFREIKEVL